MEDLERQRAVKRAYLRSEIIDQGFDPTAFTAFTEQDKSSDVDAWTLDELRDCVSRFKLSLEPSSPSRTESYQTGLGRVTMEVEDVVPCAETTQVMETERSEMDNTEKSFPPPSEMMTCSEVSALMTVEQAYTVPSHPLPHTELSWADNVSITLGK